MHRSSTFAGAANRGRMHWVVSALAYYFGLDCGISSELLVLSNNIDQYLQLVFHHLDRDNRGQISWHRFKLLCSILQLPLPAAAAASFPIIDRDDRTIDFRQFHYLLCEAFRIKFSLPLNSRSTSIATNSNLKLEEILQQLTSLNSQWLSLNLLNKRFYLQNKTTTTPANNNNNNVDNGDDRKSAATIIDDDTLERLIDSLTTENLTRELLKTQQENEYLKSIVFDLACCVQDCDARSIALEVALQEILQADNNNNSVDSNTILNNNSEDKTKNNNTSTAANEPIPIVSASDRRTSMLIVDLLKDLRFVQDSRNLQVNESRKYCQYLEKKLNSISAINENLSIENMQATAHLKMMSEKLEAVKAVLRSTSSCKVKLKRHQHRRATTTTPKKNSHTKNSITYIDNIVAIKPEHPTSPTQPAIPTITIDTGSQPQPTERTAECNSQSSLLSQCCSTTLSSSECTTAAAAVSSTTTTEEATDYTSCVTDDDDDETCVNSSDIETDSSVYDSGINTRTSLSESGNYSTGVSSGGDEKEKALKTTPSCIDALQKMKLKIHGINQNLNDTALRLQQSAETTVSSWLPWQQDSSNTCTTTVIQYADHLLIEFDDVLRLLVHIVTQGLFKPQTLGDIMLDTINSVLLYQPDEQNSNEKSIVFLRMLYSNLCKLL